jgi:hypothetical protein
VNPLFSSFTFGLSRFDVVPVLGRDAIGTQVYRKSKMELILPLITVTALLLYVVTPAIWSSDPKRRADAREVLRLLLSAFGRRSV